MKPQPTQPAASQRLLSLDALRGFDMLFIMGFAGLVTALCKLCPGEFSDWMTAQMGHADWNGFFHHDTIFPLFLFIAGISFPFSLAKQREKGMSERSIYLKVIRRGLTLVALGFVYSGLFKLDFATLRLPSVLGRIGLAWMFAALLFVNFNVRTRAVIAAAILLGYGLLLQFVAAPDAGGAGPLTLEGNIVGYVDRIVMPSHLLGGRGFDPEGLLSTLPAIVTAMLGMFTGEFVRRSEERTSGSRKTLWMAAGAVALLALALCLDPLQPINKKLWTPAFVFAAGAYSLGMFALFYYIIDVCQWRRWTYFFKVIGVNSITIYMVQRIVRVSYTSEFFFGGLASKLSPEAAAVVLSAGSVAVCWLRLWCLDRTQIYLKI